MKVNQVKPLVCAFALSGLFAFPIHGYAATVNPPNAITKSYNATGGITGGLVEGVDFLSSFLLPVLESGTATSGASTSFSIQDLAGTAVTSPTTTQLQVGDGFSILGRATAYSRAKGLGSEAKATARQAGAFEIIGKTIGARGLYQITANASFSTEAKRKGCNTSGNADASSRVSLGIGPRVSGVASVSGRSNAFGGCGRKMRSNTDADLVSVVAWLYPNKRLNIDTFLFAKTDVDGAFGDRFGEGRANAFSSVQVALLDIAPVPLPAPLVLLLSSVLALAAIKRGKAKL